MSSLIYQRFYGLPLQTICVSMVLLILFWRFMQDIICQNMDKHILWKGLNAVAFLGVLAVIVMVTLSSRDNATSVLILKPFQSFTEAKVQPEIYRSMLMNVFLFFPLGLTLPYALPEKWTHKVFMTILFALVLSVAIEFLQYCFQLGRAETDDVICNTLGCVIGTMANSSKRFFVK